LTITLSKSAFMVAYARGALVQLAAELLTLTRLKSTPGPLESENV